MRAMRRLLLATGILFVSAQASLAVTISTASFEYSTRSSWNETIEAESSGVAKSGTWSQFSVLPAVPWNSGVWLLATGSYAQANFTTPADTLLVQFEADSNDGLAQFIVDGINVGSFNTNNAGWLQVVIGGLANTTHTLRVVAANTSYPIDLAIDVFGSKISAVPLPAALPLFGTGLGLMGFVGWRRRRRASATA